MRLTFVLLLALAGCHHDTPPAHPKAGDLPPLPPSSGTPIGYLIDSSSELKLRDDQLKELKEIDASLAARDADVDSQLRQIDKKHAAEEEPPQPGQRHAKNRAPGAAGRPAGDEAKLHQIRESQDHDALRKAWALLDKDQQTSATKILQDHDVEVPGAQKKQGTNTAEDGTPVPGIEP